MRNMIITSNICFLFQPRVWRNAAPALDSINKTFGVNLAGKPPKILSWSSSYVREQTNKRKKEKETEIREADRSHMFAF